MVCTTTAYEQWSAFVLEIQEFIMPIGGICIHEVSPLSDEEYS